jgi:hypothetical protein
MFSDHHPLGLLIASKASSGALGDSEGCGVVVFVHVRVCWSSVVEISSVAQSSLPASQAGHPHRSPICDAGPGRGAEPSPVGRPRCGDLREIATLLDGKVHWAYSSLQKWQDLPKVDQASGREPDAMSVRGWRRVGRTPSSVDAQPPARARAGPGLATGSGWPPNPGRDWPGRVRHPLAPELRWDGRRFPAHGLTTRTEAISATED